MIHASFLTMITQKVYFIVAKRCLSLWIYDDCEKFNESLLPEKEDFYNHLNMEDITDADYVHAKKS